ncbi:hypothetical protein K503DRAFT_369191 [Rhizopogon vinicolor AM-OR11-026]|uniref:Uncharacterized protein n=1 Tax=Rhizopogon vinicolor AM-OR11-026 TaxID=1314800 RepID=A0A1B7NBZ8_9AGAM|nr:hypothetical protein K503DRAFT_369191 [Rhizopogon vinicolor AM-OR11-026]
MSGYDKQSENTAPSFPSSISPPKNQPIPRTYHPRPRRTGPFLQDASWVVPPFSPLKCTAPSDVYLSLKLSDFVSHDLSTDTVFEGCQYDTSNPPSHEQKPWRKRDDIYLKV